MPTTTHIEEGKSERAPKIKQLIRRLRPGDEVIFKTRGIGRIERPHVVTEVLLKDEEYRVYTEGPQTGDYFITDEAINSGPADNNGPQLFIVNNTPETNNPYEYQTKGEIRHLSLLAEE